MATQAYSYSDTIAGYVTHTDRAARSFDVRTSHGSDYRIYLTATTYARIAENL